jgi:hypothetical protein
MLIHRKERKDHKERWLRRNDDSPMGLDRICRAPFSFFAFYVFLVVNFRFQVERLFFVTSAVSQLANSLMLVATSFGSDNARPRGRRAVASAGDRRCDY